MVSCIIKTEYYLL